MFRFVKSLSRQTVKYSTFLPRNFCDVKSIPIVQFDFVKEKVLKKQLLLVDVREPVELKEEGKIPNSVNIPLGQIMEAFKMNDSAFQTKYGVTKPNSTSNFVLTCKSGKRTNTAYATLNELGYKNIAVYSGSFLDWIERGGPIEK
ncbi:rhodanese domain-containing protein CG4456-like [Parasteatoda tepidariorum]|uniref:rhodanese domain-containing protein CG4456-like n=1 Tax=Parasteatoda tepidariorum TaxID=114398 RepID=UPI0039BC389B